jgi:hypothetical protein
MTGRHHNESMASPFEPMLRGRELPKVFAEEFMLPLDGTHDALLEGSMERVWSVPWARPFLGLLSRWDVLFTETGTNIPTTMHTFVGRDRAGRLCHYCRWLKAAAIYSVAWGTANVIWPRRALRILGVSESGPLFAWQTVAMMVAAFAPAYWWASKNPRRHAHIVAVGLAAKVLGPLGFGWALKTRRLPLRFGLTIVRNDLVWWPAFASIVHDAAVSAGGWRAFLAGITSDE